MVHHFGAGLGMADWFYPAAVYMIHITANTATNAVAAADGENVNPGKAAD
jgi:hypothetical protein